MFVPIILKNVDLPAILVPVNTIPLFLKVIEFGTASFINGCTPSSIVMLTSFIKFGFVSLSPISFINEATDI